MFNIYIYIHMCVYTYACIYIYMRIYAIHVTIDIMFASVSIIPEDSVSNRVI